MFISTHFGKLLPTCKSLLFSYAYVNFFDNQKLIVGMQITFLSGYLRLRMILEGYKQWNSWVTWKAGCNFRNWRWNEDQPIEANLKKMRTSYNISLIRGGWVGGERSEPSQLGGPGGRCKPPRKIFWKIKGIYDILKPFQGYRLDLIGIIQSA